MIKNIFFQLHIKYKKPITVNYLRNRNRMGFIKDVKRSAVKINKHWLGDYQNKANKILYCTLNYNGTYTNGEKFNDEYEYGNFEQ